MQPQWLIDKQYQRQRIGSGLREELLSSVKSRPPSPSSDQATWICLPTLRQLTRGSHCVEEIDPRMQRQDHDLIIVKQYASAFFGTPLAPTLTAQGIDTGLLTGCTTSGCVRATVVDAISHGFRPIIPLEGVGDRAQDPHPRGPEGRPPAVRHRPRASQARHGAPHRGESPGAVWRVSANPPSNGG